MLASIAIKLLDWQLEEHEEGGLATTAAGGCHQTIAELGRARLESAALGSPAYSRQHLGAGRQEDSGWKRRNGRRGTKPRVGSGQAQVRTDRNIGVNASRQEGRGDNSGADYGWWPQFGRAREELGSKGGPGDGKLSASEGRQEGRSGRTDDLGWVQPGGGAEAAPGIEAAPDDHDGRTRSAGQKQADRGRSNNRWSAKLGSVPETAPSKV